MAADVAGLVAAPAGWPEVRAGVPFLAAKITAPGVPGWAVPRPRITKLIAEGTRRGPLTIKDFRPLAAEWLAQGRVHAGLILLPSERTRTRHAIAAVAAAIENVLRDHPDGLSGSERWIGPLPNL